jgi:Tfp pilus assembly protein PilN
MIKINLLPPELLKGKANATRVPYIPLAILAGVLFLLLTFFFYGDYLKARSAYKSVHTEWARLSPLMAQLKALEKQVVVEMTGEKDFLEKNVLNKEPVTQMLFLASYFLPPKVWLTELKAEREGGGCRLTLEGVALASRTQTGIEQIEEYFQKLRTKLPPQTSVAVATSKEVKDKTEGTLFVAHIEWGVTPKP